MAPPVTSRTVVSYTAFPPLPSKMAVYFCCTSLGVTSTGRYPASCPAKPGLSSPGQKTDRPRSFILLNPCIIAPNIPLVHRFLNNRTKDAGYFFQSAIRKNGVLVNLTHQKCFHPQTLCTKSCLADHRLEWSGNTLRISRDVLPRNTQALLSEY